MFESRPALARDIEGLLGALRRAADGRYAAVLDDKEVLFADEDEEQPGWAVRRFLEDHRTALFALPEAMEGEGPEHDVFEPWDDDDFLLAILNRKVAIVVACPDAGSAREHVQRPLQALADRLFRFNPSWRLRPGGGGFFAGRAQLDLVVVERQGREP